MVFNSLFGLQPREPAEMRMPSPQSTSADEASSSGSDGLGRSGNFKPMDQKANKFDDPISQAEARILNSISNETKNVAQEENWERLAGFSLGLGSLYLQEVLSYPIIIVRRQCQVNHTALKYHLTPFTAFQFMLRIQKKQGVGALWKGWGSSCVVQGIVILTEVGISELIHLPRNLSKEETPNIKGFIGNQILKSIGILLTLPFYSANLVDSVQSHQMDDSRSLVVYFKDVFYRLAGWYNSRGHGRLLPMYDLIAPTLLHGMLHYLIKSSIETLVIRFGQPAVKTKDKDEDPPLHAAKTYYTQLLAGFISSLFTDVLLFPLETVVIRLHIQGTRTIIDDTDNGVGVVPLCTNYAGMVDCFRSICRDEGAAALYKGLGALLLQFILQAFILKITKTIYKSLPQSAAKQKKNV